MQTDAPFLRGIRAKGLYKDAFDFRDLCTVGRASGKGVQRIDWMLHRGHARVVEAEPEATIAGNFTDVSEVLQSVGSDHAPLAAVFKFRAHKMCSRPS